MFYQILMRNCNRSPAKIAIKSNKIEITYKQLADIISNVISKLFKNNICKGSVVVLGTIDEYDFIVYTLSLLSMGCWVVPDVDGSVEEILQKKDCKNYIMIDEEFINNINSIEIENIQSIEIDECLNNCEDGGIYHMTSGTTGESKICVRDVSALMAEAENFICHYSLNDSERIASFCSLWHSFAFGGCLMTFVKLGCTMCLMKKMTYQDAIRFIDNQKVTMVLAVPFIIKMLNVLRLEQPIMLTNIKVFLVGAGKLERNEYFAFHKKYGVYLLSNYGSTETGAILSRTNLKAYSSVGVPMRNVKIRVVDEYGKESKIGLLYVKSKAMMKGYYNDDFSIDKDGFFNTGDIVKEKRGQYYIVGRTKLFINIAGKKINPEEIESIICEIDDVSECVVACKKDSTVEKNIIAYVVMNKGKVFSSEKISDYCREKLKSFQVPMYYQNVEQIYKDKQGKIIRNLYFYK